MRQLEQQHRRATPYDPAVRRKLLDYVHSDKVRPEVREYKNGAFVVKVKDVLDEASKSEKANWMNEQEMMKRARERREANSRRAKEVWKQRKTKKADAR